jgi:hypothetical protein
MFKVGQIHDLPGFKAQEFKDVKVTDCQFEICLFGNPLRLMLTKNYGE